MNEKDKRAIELENADAVNERKPVDVLEAMDQSAKALYAADYSSTSAVLREARAAVAELVEALRQVKQWNDVSGIDDEWPLVMESVNAALARFGVPSDAAPVAEGAK